MIKTAAGAAAVRFRFGTIPGGLRVFKLDHYQTQPDVSGNVILWYALAERIHDPEVGLRESHSLVGDEAKPPDRFSII